jgi:transposase
MERLPINPDELDAEQAAAQAAVQEDEAASHENHHKAWMHTHRLAAVKPHAALSTEAEEAMKEEQEHLGDEVEEEEDEFQVREHVEGMFGNQKCCGGLQ